MVYNEDGNKVQDAPDLSKLSGPPIKYLYIEEDESDVEQCCDLRGLNKIRIKQDLSFLCKEGCMKMFEVS